MTKTTLPPAQLLLENQVCFPLYSAANAVVRAYRPYLEHLDITYLQYMVLMVMWEKQSLNVKELGNYLHLNSGTLTPLLKRLEAKGLVKRKRSEHDERARIISITKAGMAIQELAKDIPKKLVCDLGLPDKSQQQLKQLCLQIMDLVSDVD